MGSTQLKVGLRVRDLDRSAAVYRGVGFREIPNETQPTLRYLTFGHTWLILSDLHAHGYHCDERADAVRAGPLGLGVVLAIPVKDLDATHAYWVGEGLPVTLAPEDVGFARIFYGLEPDGYEVSFEQFTTTTP